jgi:thioredoxin-related protein
MEFAAGIANCLKLQVCRLCAAFLFALIFVTGTNAEVDPGAALEVRDLASLSTHASEHSLPILLLMSASDCRYCELLKEEIIFPMLKSGHYQDKVIIREFMIDANGMVMNFDGKVTNPSGVSEKYNVAVTPTILFLDPDGLQLEERIVGVSNIDFVSHYIDKNVDRALQSMRQGTLLSDQPD